MPEATFKEFSEEIKIINEAAPKAPDRVVGVLYGALVENQLTAALKASLGDEKM